MTNLAAIIIVCIPGDSWDVASILGHASFSVHAPFSCCTQTG